MSRSCLEDWPALTFRPHGDPRKLQGMLRYDLDKRMFVPDDGGEALSWVGLLDAYPYYWCIKIPHYDNLVGQFYGQDGVVHIVLRTPVSPEKFLGNQALGDPYEDYYAHPSVLAAEEARKYCSMIYRCANEKGIPIAIRTNAEGCAWCENDSLGHRIVKAERKLVEACNGKATAMQQLEAAQEQVELIKGIIAERQEKVDVLGSQLRDLGINPNPIVGAVLQI